MSIRFVTRMGRKRTLTPQVVRAIRKLRSEGIGATMLANAFKISHTNVWFICTRKRYDDIS